MKPFFAIRTTGETRIVFLVGRYALKVARGKLGRRCNALEAHLWNWVGPARRQILCPVLWSPRGGLLNVAPRAVPISEEEADSLRATFGFPDWDYMPPDDLECPFEPKASDWGRIDGRLVALDYSVSEVEAEGHKRRRLAKMNSNVLVAAINRAISAGAVAAPPMEALGPDTSFVRTQTDVGIDPAVFESYVAELRADPGMAAFDGTFANTPSGAGVSAGLSGIARLLLARAIATNDVPGTVERFVSYVTDNAADAIAVMAISGVTLTRAIRLGPDVSLVPISSLQPSTQREMALGGRGIFGAMGPGSVSQCALITRFRFGPVFYRPPDDTAAQIPTDEAYALLGEAFDLLAVLGVYPTYQMFWAQPEDWLMSTGMSGGWQFSPLAHHWVREVQVPENEAEALAAAYFSIDPSKRNKVLRIPLDRLGRAGRERDFADRAIDLGIALESLLLHDIDGRSELSFRLSVRGAWLLGTSHTDRLEIQSSLTKLYVLRSQAVHAGLVDRDTKTGNTIARATALCQALIHKTIEFRCDIDWKRLVVGGGPT